MLTQTKTESGNAGCQSMGHSNTSKNTFGESWRNEPIQPKQKAVLEFLKMPVPPTRGGASNLIKAAFESPGGNAHEKLWNAAKHQLHPDLYPEPAKKPLPAPKPPPLFGLVMKVLLGVAVLFYAMDRFQERAQKTDGKPLDNSSPITAPAPLPLPFPVFKETMNAGTPERKPVIAQLSLQSTDGRTIQARVLAFTKDTVVIRREDGETFDLPLERLTQDSRQRIDEYRAAKRTGQVK